MLAKSKSDSNSHLATTENEGNEHAATKRKKLGNDFYLPLGML
jgi:hypothetical protein